MTLPGLFPQNRDVLASFDYVDIVSATGFVVYDGVNAITSTGNNYILVDASIASDITPDDDRSANTAATNTMTIGTGAGGGSAKFLDLDFDLSEFQLPRTIKGTATVGLTLLTDHANDVTDVFVIAKLRKWNGSSETEIASTTSDTKTLQQSAGEYGYVLPITVPLTHFKKGEQIRLTIEVWDNDADQIGLPHNPNNTAHTGSTTIVNASAGNTRLTISIPYRLDFL